MLDSAAGVSIALVDAFDAGYVVGQVLGVALVIAVIAAVTYLIWRVIRRGRE